MDADEVGEKDVAIKRPQPSLQTSSDRNFSDELWDACNECCDVRQFFLCVIFIGVVLGIFAAMVTILVYFKPVEVDIRIESAHVYNYTVIKRIEEKNNTYYAVYVVAYVDFVFVASNPSNKYSVIYSNSSFECVTRNMSLGVFTTAAFRQSPLDSTNWTRILLLDVPEPVPSMLRLPIIQDASENGVVTLNVGGPLSIRFEVAGVYFPSLEDMLNCSVQFKYMDQSNVTITC